MDFESIFEYGGWAILWSLIEPTRTQSESAEETKSIVFVHGTPWSSVVYRPVIEALAAKGNYRILVYDLPGYGQSQGYDAPSDANASSSDANFNGDTSVKFQAEALAALLEHTNMDGKNGDPTSAVVAHDIAGTIVLRAHLLLGCEFKNMMLCDANTVLPWGDGFYTLARSERATFIKLPPSIFEAVLRAVIQSACHNTGVLQSGWEDALAKPWLGGQVAQKSFVRQIAQANDADVAEMLDRDLYAQVRCDVKVLWGESDQWIPKHKVEDMVARMGERVKEVVFVPDAGHLVMLDQPERFAIELFDWVSR